MEAKNEWFEKVFLVSLFEVAGHNEKWLTAKQTAVCVQYMDCHTVRTENRYGFNNHDNYCYNWNGRQVILSYSKKNGCGTIWFGYNESEKKQLKIQNEKERKQKIIDIARKRLKRSPEKYFKQIQKIKTKISDIQDYINECFDDNDTDGVENFVKEIDTLKEELSLWESVTETL